MYGSDQCQHPQGRARGVGTSQVPYSFLYELKSNAIPMGTSSHSRARSIHRGGVAREGPQSNARSACCAAGDGGGEGGRAGLAAHTVVKAIVDRACVQ